MKKLQKVCSIVALLTIGLFIMASCSSDSDPTVSGEVVGRISGVVVDAVSFQPIEGAEVEITGIEGNSRATTTDAFGVYRFKDIPVGDYEVVVKLAGYQANKSIKVTVDAERYKQDDPAAVYEALEAQLAALIAYAGGGSLGGDVSVELTSSGVYEVTTIGLDYGTYTYDQVVQYVPLVPLTGEVTGAVKLVKYGLAGHENVLLSAGDFITIPDGTSVWLVDSTEGGLGVTGVKYGPFTTEGGTFTATALPATGEFTLWIDNLQVTEGGKTYTYNPDVSGAKRWEGDDGFKDFEIKVGYEAAQHYYEIYLFALDGYFYVTGYTPALTGSNVQVESDGGTIAITFSQAVDTTTEDSIDVSIISSSPSFSSPTFSGVADGEPTKTWSADKKTLTITFAKGKEQTAATQQAGGINYAYSGTIKFKTVTGSGTTTTESVVKAEDQSILLNKELVIPYFAKAVPGADKLPPDPPDNSFKLGAAEEVAAADLPARRVTTAAGFKLTFNRDISTASYFEWFKDSVKDDTAPNSYYNPGTAADPDAAPPVIGTPAKVLTITETDLQGTQFTPAVWVHDPTDKQVVYVYITGGILTTTEELQLFYWAINDDDPNEVIKGFAFKEGDGSKREYAGVRVYKKLGLTGFGAPAALADDITLEFGTPIPEGSSVTIGLQSSNDWTAGNSSFNFANTNSVEIAYAKTIPAPTATILNKTLTIDPTAPLNPGTTYYVRVYISAPNGEEIFNSNEDLKIINDLSWSTGGSNGNDALRFSTPSTAVVYSIPQAGIRSGTTTGVTVTSISPAHGSAQAYNITLPSVRAGTTNKFYIQFSGPVAILNTSASMIKPDDMVLGATNKTTPALAAAGNYLIIDINPANNADGGNVTFAVLGGDVWLNNQDNSLVRRFEGAYEVTISYTVQAAPAQAWN